ncbi:hypothetical protein [Aquimarina muelleri]|uniref:DUF4468 domain-containing protein n=1 Tax=Aquimarina muelleri TaxID=279356 RepID=A0A918N3U6_9FLAO|nr:hypothetical protein [Aquimarina muelleri]MCX2762172.1 hypothetical protein [Aquimarina muelleri]GGX16833.1 hypothetical protein GCM10007384_17970 [Aquimarina muelleri]
MKKIMLVFVALIISCSSKPEKIPLNEISEDLKWAADETAKNIIEFCNNEKALDEFNLRSSTKSKLQKGAGKYLLTCILYSTEVTDIQLGNLYRVNKLKGNIKRFKYKLDIASVNYDIMELHLDLNSNKFIANYTIHGKQKDGKWVSVLDKLELEARKFMKNLN